MSAPVAFTYDAIASDVATDLRAVADRIRERDQRTKANIMETGRELLQVKARLKHGEFTRWLAAEFGWSDRTAQNYMQLATWSEGRTEIVSALPTTTAYLLAAPSTAPEIGEEVVAAIRAGERIDPAEIKQRVRQERASAAKAKREAQRQAWRKERLSPETIKRQDRKAARERAETERLRRKQDELVAGAVAILRKRLSPEEAESIRDLLKLYWAGQRLAAALESDGGPESTA